MGALRVTVTLHLCAALVVLPFVFVRGAEKCTTTVNSCKCSTSAGDIDLKPLDSPSNPLQWQSPGSLWAYSYNPCTGFVCGSGLADAAVCEKYTVGSQNYKLGTQSSAQFMYDTSTSENYLQYSSGGTTVKVYLACDNSENGRITTGPSAPVTNYMFRLSSKYACPGGTGGGGSGGLSAGSVLLIIFFCLVFVYFVGGALFMHFVKHETGVNLIPNVEFWAQLPGLIRDGCVFTYSTIAALITGRNRAGYTEA